MSKVSPFDPDTEAQLVELRARAHEFVADADPPPLRKEASVQPHAVAGAAGLAAAELSRAIVTSDAVVEARAKAEVDRIVARLSAVAPPEVMPEADAAIEKGSVAPDDEARAVGVGLMPHRIVSDNQSMKRFATSEPEPDRVMELDAAHPAAMEGRTIFPSTVVGAAESARFLVSGHNKSKLGKKVTKGPWAGMTLFHVTLEERATCPRSCQRWLDCYGSAMPFARRNDHRDPEFLAALDREVRTVARAHPDGFVVRLHTLGDFYSMDYLNVWGDLLLDLPNLHIFGYTHRREDADDEESRELATAIRMLTEVHWSRFAIRRSDYFGPEGEITVMAPVDHPHVIMCPAQTGQTEACATCGLCWSEAARGKTIGFLLHGRKRPRTNAEREAMPEGQTAAPATQPRPLNSPTEQASEWRRRYEGGESVSDIAGPFGSATKVRKAIIDAGGRIRSREEAVSLLWARKAVQRQRLAQVDEEAIEALPPRSSGVGRVGHARRAKIAFEPGEQDRLIAEALSDPSKVRFCAPAFAVASVQSKAAR